MSNYTSILPCDVEILEKCLKAVLPYTNDDVVRFLEIGVFGGDTARGVKAWCDKRGLELEYCGIDNCAQLESQAPFPGAYFIKGDSAEVFHKTIDNLDIVFVDGCHCVNHVILDTIHYGRLVKAGGFMIFHDTSPEIQQTMRDPHGPDIPEFSNSVILAHNLMRFPFYPWDLRWEKYQPGAKSGGSRAFQKEAE